MSDDRSRELLDAALSYAARGWRVLPLFEPLEDGRCSCARQDCYLDGVTGRINGSPGKHPRTAHGLTDATTDPEQIRRWWGMWPLSNVGIATGPESNLVVLDIDERHGGPDTLARLEERFGHPPPTVCSLTGAGLQLYFTHPGVYTKTTAGQLGPGLDTRADGGYVVAPPSLHMTGRLYAWEGSGDPDEVPLTETPRWLNELLQQPRERVNGNGHGPLDAAAKIPLGRRREAWKVYAAQLHNDGVPFEKKVRLMMTFAAEMFEQPETAQESDARGLAAWYEGRDASTPMTAPLRLVTEAPAERREPPAPREEPWPDFPLDESNKALHGLAGEVVRAMHPYTEADPVAILTHFLVFFGNAAGTSPHFRIGGTRHSAKLFAVLVGDSATGRKGTSEALVRYLFEHIDPAWVRQAIRHGMASGEGLIRAFDPVDEGGHPKEPRLMMVEPELVNVLKAMSRDGSTLSGTLRMAWDSDDLEIGRSAKKNSIRVTGAHTSALAHVTRGELLRTMDSSQNSNGFANRFLWVMVRRSKLLPAAPQVPHPIFNALAHDTVDALSFATDTGEMVRDNDAQAMWFDLYPKLSTPPPGLFGLVTQRAGAQVIRLAMVYALLDSSRVVHPEHLEAALAFWDFSSRCAALIFGRRLGNPIAQRILDELHESETGELSRTELSEALGRNIPGLAIEAAIASLIDNGDALIYRPERPPGERGRRVEMVRLITRGGPN